MQYLALIIGHGKAASLEKSYSFGYAAASPRTIRWACSKNVSPRSTWQLKLCSVQHAFVTRG
jgi:hypothetical protein